MVAVLATPEPGPLSLSDAVSEQPIGLTRRIDREHYVYILKTDRPEPVFHRWAPLLDKPEPDGDGPGIFTGCGRRLTSWKTFTRHFEAKLRPAHAMTFARPCRSCWGNPF